MAHSTAFPRFCSIALASFTGLLLTLPAQAGDVTVFTSFEFTINGTFSVGTSPARATFSNGVAERRGIGALYHSGNNAWHVDGTGSVGTVTFETPPSRVHYFMRYGSSSVAAVTRVFDVDGVEIFSTTGSTSSWTEIDVSRTGGQTLIGSVTLENAGAGTSVFDDFEFTVTTAEPGTAAFSAATYSVGETAGSVTITVQRSDGSEGAASVAYTTSDGTATAGDDYTTAAGTINWADNDSVDKTFVVTISDDLDLEGAETFQITLSNPSTVSLGSPSVATVTINDDESPGTLAFTASSFAIGESDAMVTISVSRSGGSSEAASVNFATSDGTATEGVDYSSAIGTLNWADGESGAKTFDVTIQPDTDAEGDETVDLTLSGVSGATLGFPSTAEIVIVDDDVAPPVPTPLDDPIPETIATAAFNIRLVQIAPILVTDAPNWGTVAPGIDGHLFVTDQSGIVWNITLDVGGAIPFLDVSGRLVDIGFFGPDTFDERGLLGLAFHPDYATNGLLYTYTSEPLDGAADFSTIPDGSTADHQSVVTEWQVFDPADEFTLVDTASARVVLRIDQPQFNHDAGGLVFDSAGRLFISLGDGGGADDVDGPDFLGSAMVGHGTGNGQDASNPLGTLLRIDPLGNDSANGRYGIPPSNPFVGEVGVVGDLRLRLPQPVPLFHRHGDRGSLAG